MADIVRFYGIATTINTPLIASGGGILTSAGWTPAAGDVKVSLDGAAAANIATLPTYVTDIGWDFDLSATEMQNARIDVRLTSAVTEAELPDGFNVVTMGHPSAMFPGVPEGAIFTTIATLSSQTVGTLTAGSADDDAYNGWVAIFRDATTSTQQSIGVVKDYTGSTKQYTLQRAPLPTGFTVAASDYIILLPPGSARGLGLGEVLGDGNATPWDGV